jgi:hypothetical protein
MLLCGGFSIGDDLLRTRPSMALNMSSWNPYISSEGDFKFGPRTGFIKINIE